MSPSFPLEPATEMSEAQYMGYCQIGEDEREYHEPDDVIRHFMPQASLNRALRANGYRVVEGAKDLGVSISCHSDAYLWTVDSDALRAGASLLTRLRGKIWRTRDGQELTVEQMALSHVQNLIPWLERRARLILHAAQIEIACQVIDHDGGEMAHEALEHAEAELHEIDALEFLSGLPLYQALKARTT